MNAPHFAAEADGFARRIDGVSPSAPEQRYRARRQQTFDGPSVHHRLHRATKRLGDAMFKAACCPCDV
jgi:hypothetical protein